MHDRTGGSVGALIEGDPAEISAYGCVAVSGCDDGSVFGVVFRAAATTPATS